MPRSLRSYTTYHDTIGLWHVPNVKMRHLAVGSKRWYVRTNGDGLRDDRDLPKAKPNGKTRITLLGDSFTFGHSVEVEERYSNLLEQSLDKVEVLNFGLCSAGLDQEFLVYDKIASQWESDILMINPYLNNVGRALLTHHMFQGSDGTRKMYPKPYFELKDDEDELVLHNVPVPRDIEGDEAAKLEEEQKNRAGARVMEGNTQNRLIQTLKSTILDHRLKYLAIKALPIQPYQEFDSTDAPGWKLARRILLELRKVSKQKSMVITPLPAWSTMINPALATYRERFAELHDPSAGIYVLDILPHFLELSFSDRIRCVISTRDTHYSAFGHQIVARGIAAELEKTGLLSAAQRQAS